MTGAPRRGASVNVVHFRKKPWDDIARGMTACGAPPSCGQPAARCFAGSWSRSRLVGCQWTRQPPARRSTGGSTTCGALMFPHNNRNSVRPRPRFSNERFWIGSPNLRVRSGPATKFQQRASVTRRQNTTAILCLQAFPRHCPRSSPIASSTSPLVISPWATVCSTCFVTFVSIQRPEL